MIKNIFPKKGPAKSIWILIQGAVVFSHGCVGALGGIAWFFWQDLQDFSVISISLPIFGHHTQERARPFIVTRTSKAFHCNYTWVVFMKFNQNLLIGKELLLYFPISNKNFQLLIHFYCKNMVCVCLLWKATHIKQNQKHLK